MLKIFKIIFSFLIISSISWIFFVPHVYKFAIKYMIYQHINDDVIVIHDKVEVDISLGKVIGSKIFPNIIDEYHFFGNKIYQFLGVPYAEPPIGKLRFKKPVPVSKWKPKVLIANDYSNSCMQNDTLFGVPMFIGKMSEDCLYLNIWTPSLPSSADAEEDLKPVLVFVHGGGFFMGSSSQNIHRGHVLSSTQNIVVVTMNYRLGPFGFLVSKDEKHAPGNAGLWDQVLALEWVQEHIRYFGGDPSKVTFGGQSAGALSVSIIHLSHVADNLFNDMILMSGSSLIAEHGQNNPLRKEYKFKQTKHLANNLNCPTEDEDQMMECLMSVNSEKLVIRGENVIKSFPFKELAGTGLMLFSPTIDGDMLKDDTFALASKYARNGAEQMKKGKKRRVISGNVNWEGGMIRIVNNHCTILDRVKANNDSFYEGMIQYLMDDFNLERGDAKEIVDAYPDECVDQEVALLTMIGDIRLTCPSIFESELMSQNYETFRYVFTYDNKNNELFNIFCPDDNLVCHGNDIYFNLGLPLLKKENYIFDYVDADQSVQSMNLIGSLVKGGKLYVTRGRRSKKYGVLLTYNNSSNWKTLDMNILKDNHNIEGYRHKYCNLIRKHIFRR